MTYFTDHDIPNTISIGITNVLTNITQKPDSHKGGWAKILRCQLQKEGFNATILDKNSKLSEYDIIIFDLGAEFKKVFNVFGGLGPQYLKRIQELLSIKGATFSWQHQVPSLRELIQSRIGKKSTSEGFGLLTEEQLSKLEQISSGATVFDHVIKKNHLLIGDSHTPAIWTPDMVIERRDGRTLAGALENGTLTKYVDNPSQYSAITVHLSSIDIRHHVQRCKDPASVLINMVLELEKQLQEINIPAVTICHSMGIEDESRKLPKTGLFKSTAYYGNWSQREYLRDLFNKAVDGIAKRNGWFTLAYPEHFFNDKGQLDFSVMERPASVHISPSNYRCNLDNNQLRWQDI